PSIRESAIPGDNVLADSPGTSPETVPRGLPPGPIGWREPTACRWDRRLRASPDWRPARGTVDRAVVRGLGRSNQGDRSNAPAARVSDSCAGAIALGRSRGRP